MSCIKHRKAHLTTFSNNGKKVESMMQSEVFLMNYEMFGNESRVDHLWEAAGSC